MRSAGNFHPEWGYLAPAPTFVRTVRIALVATAIGAVAGAAVVVSLVQRPGSNDDNAIAAHALLTRAPVISSPAAGPHTTAPAVATVTPPKPQVHQPQQFAATTAPSTNAPSPSTGAAAPASAATPSPDVIASTDKPDKVDSVSPPLPLPAPTDATVATNAPVGEAARVPAEADEAVAPDTAEPRMPAKKSVAKRHRYEPYRRQETRGRWHDNGGFGPLFRLFSFRTGSPYSSN